MSDLSEILEDGQLKSAKDFSDADWIARVTKLTFEAGKINKEIILELDSILDMPKELKKDELYRLISSLKIEERESSGVTKDEKIYL